MQGKNFQLDIAPLLSIPIKIGIKEIESKIISVVDKIHSLKKLVERTEELENKLDELIYDLRELVNLVKKPIIFQTHVRPNIIFNDDKLKIVNREIIYNACKQIEKEFDNIVVYDPSEIIKTHGISNMINKNELKN